MERHLVSTTSGERYPFDRRAEFAENGESLEVEINALEGASLHPGSSIWQRFADFLPFDNFDPAYSLGEGNTPLLESKQLAQKLGLETLLLKNETLNPTWSFKDRGSLPCILLAKELNETSVATISTGNMGSSIAAYGARSGIRPIILIPPYCPEEKIHSMAIHGATIIKIESPDYGTMKKKVLSLADPLKLRIVSGNGPIRVEGYKFTSFELYEQLHGEVPDYIAVPTSACGHLRGLFKGYRELKQAGLIRKLPRMIIVQAAKNSPLVTAFKQKKKAPVPFTHVRTIATAITTGNPPGGEEILEKAYQYDWLAEEASEEEILAGQKLLGEAGFFVEPSSAASIPAIHKLRQAGKIERNARVVVILTGSGLKDTAAFARQNAPVIQSSVSQIEADLRNLLKS